MRGATWLLALAASRGVAGITDGAGYGATCGERAPTPPPFPRMRDTPPFEVKLQRKRVNFLQRKIVADEPDERKEDSDDESEEDEARHPLIVHDRDPEQNLEALRDPSRYRQNLA